MAVYQIYKILFNRSRQGNLLSKMDGRSAYDKAQELLEEMLGGVLPLTKEKRDKTLVPLESYVEKKRDGVTVMVVCNEKNHKYREKLEEHELVYHPGCRVIIDNRPGIAQLAIERSQSFDGKTDKVRDILLPEYTNAEETESTLSRKGLVEPETIKKKFLFYNEQEQHQIDTLGNLLEESRFKKVQERLSESGMRTGFACLLYGGPGTGKTETVYQLARRTGRAIMPVNISEIRDKFVGETEKRIKHVFDKYRAYVKESQEKDTLCPILFFNEADAIISKRSENVERSVDKMENAMQNIILQEMENLDGILIATTNLTSNLDSAFERRFIYKIELSKPSREVKSLIWQSMMPDLCEYDADELATSYDFSGGQIENVVRKQAINWVLYGKNASLDDLRTICNEESISNNKTRSRIGFYA